jgi:hypothetical protein
MNRRLVVIMIMWAQGAMFGFILAQQHYTNRIAKVAEMCLGEKR